MSGFGFGVDRFGWTDDALADVARLRGWTEDAIERLELGWDGEHVGFPIRDATGDELGTLRYLPDPTRRNGRRKMRQPAGVPRQLFPPPELLGDDVDQLLLDEGESDTVAAWSSGFTAVGVPGAENWNDEWADRFSGRRWTIYVCGDCDKAGRDFANRAAASLAAAGVDARIVELDPARDDGYDLTELLRERGADALRELIDAAEPYARGADEPAGGRFHGLTHRELLELDVPAASELIVGIMEQGTLGTFAGLPETFKSWLAAMITFRIAGVAGVVLGRDVVRTGPAGYWWQDDSRENEIRRVQAYARTNGYTDALPIRWHLNEGLTLPAGIDVLRDEIEREQQVLVVLDSLYNFLAGVKLKDEDVAAILQTLKSEVCDPTGCTLAFVDHSPWPTEANHSRRNYGSVFKTAAIRWGIYLDRNGDTVFVEAHGNNLTGLTRTPAIWDPEQLELRIVQPPSESDDLGDRIDDFLRRNPGAASKVVYAGVGGKEKPIRERLEADGRFQMVPAAMFGKPKNTKCWARVEDVADLLKEFE